MNRTTGEKFDIREEIKIIPRAMVLVAALLFVGVEALFFLVLIPHNRPYPPPLAVQVLLPPFLGSLLVCFTLLVGYVNRDAKRRGMNSTLWTVLVLLIPDAIGFVIYFVVRQPILGACPHCGVPVNPGFNYCPQCKFNLHPACPQCHRAIELGAAFCPYCSAELKGQA